MLKILYHGDCLNFLRTLDFTFGARYDCIIADPPDNIGLRYNSYDDAKPNYLNWLVNLTEKALRFAPVFWLSFNHKYDYRLKGMLFKKLEMKYAVRTYIWRFEFGQYNERDNPNGYRPIMRISHESWKPIMSERVPSLREKVGDNRATGLGRVPDDVWEYSRVQGNNSERRSWHPTQHPEDLYRRIIRMSLPMVDNRRTGKLLDLFAGTGTCFRCTWDDMVTTGIEIDPLYCEKMREEHEFEEFRTV